MAPVSHPGFRTTGVPEPGSRHGGELALALGGHVATGLWWEVTGMLIRGRLLMKSTPGKHSLAHISRV